MRIPRSDGVIQNRQTTSGKLESSGTQASTRMGEFAFNIADRFMDQRSETEALEIKNKMAREASDLEFEFKTKKVGKDALGASQEYETKIKDLESKYTSDISGRTKNKLGGFAASIRESGRQSVMAHEFMQEKQLRQSVFETGVQTASEMIRKDAKSWDKAVAIREENFQAAVKAGVIPEHQYQKVKTESDNQFRNELGKNYYAQNKHEFIKNMDMFGFGEPEKAAYKEKYQKDLIADQREKKALFAVEAKMEMDRFDDYKIQATEKGDTSFLEEGYKKLSQYGYHEQAQKFKEQATISNKVHDFKQSNRGMGLAEEAQAISQLQLPDEADGTSEQYKFIKEATADYERRAKQFSMDPGEYSKSREFGFNTVERVNSRLEFQKQQQVMPKEGYRITSNQERDQWKATLNSADLDQKVEMVLGAKTDYQQHFPKLIQEMGLNSSATHVSIINDKQDAKLLIQAITEKPVFTGGMTKNDLRAAAADSEYMALLQKQRERFPLAPGIDKTVTDHEEAIVSLSAKKNDPRFGGEFFDKYNKSFDEGDKLLAIPSDHDEDDIFNALDAKKLDLQKAKGDDFRNRAIFRETTWVNTDDGKYALLENKTGLPVPGGILSLKEIQGINSDTALRRTNLRNRIAEQSSGR